MSQRKPLLLGSPRLHLGGEEIHIGRRKALALVAYLTVTCQTHSRDTLATLLWPEYDQSRARADLRRNLSLLNRTLGDDWLIADRESARVNPKAGIWLAVNAFHRLLAECKTHDHPSTEACIDCVPLLEEAVDLYRGHFLAGLTLRDSLAFDEWQYFQTERLRDELASALVRLANFFTSQGNFEPAIAYARRWMAIDPLREPAHRHLMVLYAQSGQRGAALRQYETCRQLLNDELGVEPAEKTEAVRPSTTLNRRTAVFDIESQDHLAPSVHPCCRTPRDENAPVAQFISQLSENSNYAIIACQCSHARRGKNARWIAGSARAGARRAR
jgi:DNA-binding SARP family transcriptional activator